MSTYFLDRRYNVCLRRVSLPLVQCLGVVGREAGSVGRLRSHGSSQEGGRDAYSSGNGRVHTRRREEKEGRDLLKAFLRNLCLS